MFSLFLGAAISFLYSLEEGYTSVTSLVASVSSTVRLGLLDMAFLGH